MLITTMFEERQKATRALKRLKKRLDASSLDTSEYKHLEKEVHDAEIDVNYTIYHPLTEKYQSLFPRQEDVEGGETAARKLVAKKPAMWQRIEQCTVEGTLEALRDGKLATSTPLGTRNSSAPEKSRSKHDSKNVPTGSKSLKAIVRQAQDEESDGGFFEE